MAITHSTTLADLNRSSYITELVGKHIYHTPRVGIIDCRENNSPHNS